MSETPPSGEKLPLSPEENAQLLHLSQDCSNNLRHAKAQQWQTGYLTLLAYGALVTAARVLTDSSPPLPAAWPYFFMSIWSVLSFVAGAFGIVVIWDLQMWMGRLRKSMGDAEVHFSEKYKKNRQPLWQG